MDEKEKRAREKLEIIMLVRSGQITASEGAQRLGYSRKTYYEWENRGLEALMNAMEPQDAGRPATETDPEKEAMAARIQALEQELQTTRQIVEVKKLQLEHEKKQRALDRLARMRKKAKKKRK